MSKQNGFMKTCIFQHLSPLHTSLITSHFYKASCTLHRCGEDLMKNLLPSFKQSPGLPEALSYVDLIRLPLASCCHSFWTLPDCLYILTALFVSLWAYFPAFSSLSCICFFTAHSLVSCFRTCRSLVCHRRVVTARSPSLTHPMR